MGKKGKESGLVPEKFEDFRSLEFWDGFFDERGDKPFEWYGAWRQLKPFLEKDCTEGREVLVLGCGNSELSADLYDSGCQAITNIDFSRKVIASMMAKNLRKRPKMKWKIGDMTDMKFGDSSFDIAVDKGGLDALMGEDSEEGNEAGQKLLSEVARVLGPGGVYLCITLAQSHVLRLLLDSFGSDWSLDLASVPPSPDMAQAPVQPVYVRAVKGGMAGIRSSLKPSPQAPNAEQLAEILPHYTSSTLAPRFPAKDQSEALYSCTGDMRLVVDAGVHVKPKSMQSMKKPSMQMIADAQADRASKRQRPGTVAAKSKPEDYDKLHPGRRLVTALPCQTSTFCRSEAGLHASARFSATVLDVAGAVNSAAVHECCVFIVPQGRESEWLFASQDGQWQIAGQCSSKRVILVTLNRGHRFGSTEAVRAELSPLVLLLAPAAVRSLSEAVPIMTTQEGVGCRREVDAVESSTSGRIVVEDVAVLEGEATRTVRRMAFVSNRGLVQSEAVLRGTGGNAVPPSHGGKKKSNKKKSQAGNVSFEGLHVDQGTLAMEYHNHIVAGVCLGSCLSGGAKSLVVGLGGGGLAAFLHRFLGVCVEAVELDPAVVELAKRHFGFEEGPDLKARIADGLVAVSEVAEAAPQSLGLIVVDAGSGDASLVMSCPPPPFLEAQFLRHAHAALKPSGMLAVNCVTRLDSAFKAAAAAVQAVFACVYFSVAADDVNRVVFGTQAPIPAERLADGKLAALVRGAMSDGGDVAQINSITEQFSGLILHAKSSA